MKKLLLIPFCLILFTAFGQTNLTIQSTTEKVGTVQHSAPNLASGDQGFAAYAAGTAQEIRMGEGNLVRTFLQFDLSSIPAGSKVNWAKLTLYNFGQMFGFNSSKLRRVIAGWDPKTVTWNNQPNATKRGQVSLANISSETDDDKNINVYNLVKAMVDSPATSFGFLFKLDTEYSAGFQNPRDMTFYSPDLHNAHKNPKLVIEYTAPGLLKHETTLSVDLSGETTEMNIYPNPCNGIFNCNIKSASTNYMKLRVIDLLGRTVYSQPVNTSSLQMRVNLPSSSAGTYFVVLQDDKGATIVSQQLQVN